MYYPKYKNQKLLSEPLRTLDLSYWVVNINLGKCFLIHRDHCFFLLQGTEEGMNTVVKKFIPILSECLIQVCWVCLVPCYWPAPGTNCLTWATAEKSNQQELNGTAHLWAALFLQSRHNLYSQPKRFTCACNVIDTQGIKTYMYE